MPEIGPYGVTQHADAAQVTANQLVGEQVASTRADAVGPGVSSAQMWSTAPYKPRKNERGPKGCYANEGTCRAPAMRGEKYCFFHKPGEAR